jgi:tetratricopeptide (TPR) repeat protein
LALMVSACSSHKPPSVTPPDQQLFDRLHAADSLVRAGCFDCLEAAFSEYDALRLRLQPGQSTTKPGQWNREPTQSANPVGELAIAGAVRTAALLAIRERELGTEDSGYLARARELLASGSDSLRADTDPLLDIADTLPSRSAGFQVADDIDLNRRQAAFRNRQDYLERLHEQADRDPLSAYLWLAFNCAYPTRVSEINDWLMPLQVWRETPLIDYKRATCGRYDTAALQRLAEADERFVELNYSLGQAALLSGKIDEAIDRFERAYGWRSRWPAVSNALAASYLALEEFAQAVRFFDETLAVVPRSADALLGKARAQIYLGGYTESLATVDQLLALEHWYVGDARYLRAVSEVQLERNDEAWNDLEIAAKLIENAEVPKLAGIVAYRRHQLNVARAKFQESRSRNPLDCETGFYLGSVLAEQAAWNPTVETLMETETCLVEAEKKLEGEIAGLGEPSDHPGRQARQIERREQEIAKGRRMQATSWFDMAVAYYSLARKDDARRFADLVKDDTQFGERAREILARTR